MQARTLNHLPFIMLLLFSAQTLATPNCSMTVSPLNFGNYNPLQQANLRTRGAIAVRCTGAKGEVIPYQIKIAAGSSGTFSYRTMVSQDKKLDYNIYLDPAQTTVWGDGTDGSSVLKGQCAMGTTCSYSVYGAILSSADNAAAGSYMGDIRYILTVGNAADVIANGTASAVVNADCVFSLADNLNFGSYDPTVDTPNDNAQGIIRVRCARNTQWDIYITGARTMHYGAYALNYQIYRDSARTSIWPASSPGITGIYRNISESVYGRIPALQDVAAGPYSGTLTLTVDFYDS